MTHHGLGWGWVGVKLGWRLGWGVGLGWVGGWVGYLKKKIIGYHSPFFKSLRGSLNRHLFGVFADFWVNFKPAWRDPIWYDKSSVLKGYCLKFSLFIHFIYSRKIIGHYSAFPKSWKGGRGR